jgi:hypothetical protein
MFMYIIGKTLSLNFNLVIGQIVVRYQNSKMMFCVIFEIKQVK